MQPATLTYTVGPGDKVEWLALFFGIRQQQIKRVQSQTSLVWPDIAVKDKLQILFNAYEVRSGDTLTSIELLFGLANTLQAANGITDPNQIQIGQILTIPGESINPFCQPLDLATPPLGIGVSILTIHSPQELVCVRGNLSVATLLFANPDILSFLRNRIESHEIGLEIRVPPADGILYEVKSDGYSLADLAQQFTIPGGASSIVDWSGNQVGPALTAGQLLFLPLVDGRQFMPYGVLGPAVVSSSGAATLVAVTGEAYTYAMGVGDPPPGAQKPSAPYPWFGARTQLDAGWCAYRPGSGWNGNVVWPVSAHEDVRPFEPGHIAIDITGHVGDPVYAAATGLVVWAGYSSWGGGNIIALDHGGGWLTIYAHLNGVAVGCHQMVSQGETIGELGQSGGTSWPHVHFEVHYNGFAYDPMTFLP